MLLLMKEELCVCDIISVLKLPQSTVSRHLAYLRKSGLVKDRRSGLWMYYSLLQNGDAGFQNELLVFLRQKIDTLEQSVADKECLKALRNDRCD